ncbi:MAG: GNAT family N-acetyltransferase [Caulobacteraceae bacterium]
MQAMELAARILENRFIRVEPLEERHRAALIAMAEAEPAIFRLMPYPVAENGFGPSFDWLIKEREAGRWIPHAVMRPSGEVIGQSCYLTIRPRDAGVEIGGTWYVRAAQGTAVNPAAKHALLENAFAQGAERVEFKTDALNDQSRAALTKLGATFEGVHRRHMKRHNGTWRDSAYFAIIREEWPAIRARLEARLAAFD